MNVTVPDSIRHLEPALAEFIDGMVFKLHVNSHKDSLPRDIPGLIDKMIAEMEEFKEQYRSDPSDPNVLSETYDASNFWFLIHAFLRQEGVATMRERFIEEYYDVRPNAGKVLCFKKRSGSKYGPGDEITGTKNSKGEVLLRAQSASGGFGVTILRSHLVWREAMGSWPVGEVAHKDGDNQNDAISNLVMLHGDEAADGKFPFVTQWMPSGREAHPNYGKWVYQRRHMFQLVRVGYWDTAREAAELGLKEWKQKTLDKQEKSIV